MVVKYLFLSPMIQKLQKRTKKCESCNWIWSGTFFIRTRCIVCRLRENRTSPKSDNIYVTDSTDGVEVTIRHWQRSNNADGLSMLFINNIEQKLIYLKHNQCCRNANVQRQGVPTWHNSDVHTGMPSITNFGRNCCQPICSRYSIFDFFSSALCCMSLKNNLHPSTCTQSHTMQVTYRYAYLGWLCGSMVERWSLVGKLSLSCAPPVPDDWPLLWVNRPL